jgi:prepilin-type N-terminal cleavage/methylation domain-containing protein
MKLPGRKWNVESRGIYALRLDVCSRFRPSAFDLRLFRRAFTLIELMVVVAILGIILAMGAPTLYHVLKKEGFRKSVSDLMEACSAARARAILSQQITEIDFNPKEKSCQVSGGSEGGWGDWSTKAKFDDDVYVEMLDVNLSEYKDADYARVRFFPNGTSDEMTLIVRKGDEWRRISLELTTGLASLDTDPNKWR